MERLSAGRRPLPIVTGYSDGCFGAGDPITRQQMAVMLYRFARALGMETVQSGVDARGFDDFEQVSAYAEEAIAWAANAAILRGADNRLMPPGPLHPCPDGHDAEPSAGRVSGSDPTETAFFDTLRLPPGNRRELFPRPAPPLRQFWASIFDINSTIFLLTSYIIMS